MVEYLLSRGALDVASALSAAHAAYHDNVAALLEQVSVGWWCSAILGTDCSIALWASE
jgi:hypothetical protein